jgi:hypothetical protein
MLHNLFFLRSPKKFLPSSYPHKGKMKKIPPHPPTQNLKEKNQGTANAYRDFLLAA